MFEMLLNKQTLLQEWSRNLRKLSHLKVERSFHRKEKVSRHSVSVFGLQRTPQRQGPFLILIHFAIDAAFSQTQWGRNLVGNQAVSQVAKNPSKRSRRRRRSSTNQAQRLMAATNNTSLLSSKLTKALARGSLTEEV